MIISQNSPFKVVIQLQSEIEENRLGAYVDGFLSGLGLVLIIWGLASIVTVTATASAGTIGLVLLGVVIFAGGGFREAYTWGRLSERPVTPPKAAPKQAQRTPRPRATTSTYRSTAPAQATRPASVTPNRVTSEQIREPYRREARKPVHSQEQEA
jgi:hypothetical protein